MAPSFVGRRQVIMLAIFRSPRGELDAPPDGGCVLPFAYRTVLTVAQIIALWFFSGVHKLSSPDSSQIPCRGCSRLSGPLCPPSQRVDIRFVCLDAGVPVPPAHRLFEPLFLSVGRLDQWMEIEDPRRLAQWLGLAPRKVFWRDLVPSDAEIIVLDVETGTENADTVRRVSP